MIWVAISAGTYSVNRSSASSGENLYRTGSSGALGGSLAAFLGPAADDAGGAAVGFDMDDRAGFFGALALAMARGGGLRFGGDGCRGIS